MNNQYSTWLKIDLHIHSDKSRETKDGDYKGAFSIDNLKLKLSENEVKIFSITDHNIINVDAYREYYEKYSENEDPLLVLGVELDVLVKKDDGQDKKYHTLLIFNCTNITEVESINTKLESIYNERNIVEKKERVITIENIATYFQESDFFFIPHANSERSIVDAYKNNDIQVAQKMVLLMPCALEKVTKEEIIHAYNKGFNELLTINFRSKNDIPYINFSDNHCIDNYPCRHKGDNGIGNHEFYYIKGSKCFESIRLAFIDPESRIKTSIQYNNINHLNSSVLDLLKIDNDEFVNNAELVFSPHLNVIIGGRSSGKSLLMWYIGNKISTSIVENKYPNYNPDNVSIKSKYDAELSKTISLSLDNIIYIKQGDIISYFESGELTELAKKSNKLSEYNRCKDMFKEHKKTLLSSIENVFATYKKIFDDAPTKKYTLHNIAIQNILSPHFILKYEYENTKKKINNIKSIDNSIALLKQVYDDINSIVDNVRILDITTAEEEIIISFVELICNKQTLLHKKRHLNNIKIKFIDNIKNIVVEANSNLSIDAQEKELSNQALDLLISSISNRFKLIRSMKVAADSLESLTNKYVEQFSINTDINLVLDASINDSIKGALLEGIKNSKTQKSVFYNLLKLLFGNDQYIKNHMGNHPDKLKLKFKTQVQFLINELETPKDYLKYEDGEISKNKSPGYNSEKYLKIILNNPNVDIVFIDQPEDNLGNKFIADTLVKLIRDIKFKKQIFLVTHNPSVVVYGDAESVILAKNEDNKISYTQIVLENTEAQKEICDILDGGEYIFNNRYKKYNIQRILKNTNNGQ